MPYQLEQGAGPAQYSIQTTYLSNKQSKKNLAQRTERKIDYIGFYTPTPAPQYNPDFKADPLAKSINASDRWDGEHPLAKLSRTNNDRYMLSMRTRSLVSPTRITRSLYKQEQLKQPGPDAYRLPTVNRTRSITINNSPQRPVHHLTMPRPGPNEYQDPSKPLIQKKPPRDVHLYKTCRDTTSWMLQ